MFEKKVKNLEFYEVGLLGIEKFLVG